MKRVICLILSVCMLAALYGCGDPKTPTLNSEPEQSSYHSTTEPTDVSDAELSVSPETEPSALSETESSVEFAEKIPIIFSIVDDTGDVETATGDLYYWDLQSGTLSYAERAYDVVTNGIFMLPEHWDGGTHFIGKVESAVCPEGYTFEAYGNRRPFGMSYGRCYYDNESDLLFMINEDGSLTTSTVAKVPDEVIETLGHPEALMHTPATYATITGENVFLVYTAYESWLGDDGNWHDYADVYYGTHPINQPEKCTWSVTHLPEETSPAFIATSWMGALIDNKLYLPSTEDVIVIDTATGEWSFLGIFDKLWELCGEGATSINPIWGDQHGFLPQGSYNGTLVVLSVLFDSKDQEHNYLTAVRNGQIQGVIEIDITDRAITVYDAEMNQTDYDDFLTGTSLFFMYKVAKND
ncbi:MAG: hypothetical protein IJ357_03715 [Oscillospiraceae bacterium]|nr:hypothetical protein [Oscillospiraceae bacterium]